MKTDAASLNSVPMRELKNTLKAMHSHTWNSSLSFKIASHEPDENSLFSSKGAVLDKLNILHN